MKNLSQVELNELFLKSAAQGDIGQATECLINGADLNAKTLKGYNALFLSATRSKREFFDWILEVDQKGKKIDVNNKNNEGNTVLFEIVKDNLDSFYIKGLVDNGALVDKTSTGGVTPLLQACANCNVEQVKTLLDYKANPNHLTDGSKTTPFLMAGAEGNFELVKLLIENGANVHEVDSFGRNILISALFKPTKYMKKDEKEEHKKLLSFLVEDSNINLDYVAQSGITALWLASYMGNKELVIKILEKTNTVEVWHQLDTSEGKLSALHQWCKIGNPEIVTTLLAKGAKLSVFDETGNIPEAYGFIVPELRQILLDNNADVNAVLTVRSKDPRALPSKIPVFANVLLGGDTEKEIVKEMIKRGVRITYEEPELHKHEPLLIAIASSAPELVELLLDEKKININKLLAMNLSVENSDSISFMSLLCSDAKNQKLAAVMQQKEQYELLMKAKETNDKNGIKSEIVSNEQFEKIEKDLKKLTEVENLLDGNQKKIFDAIIKAGYNVDLENESGKTALFYCKDTKYAQWLKDEKADLFHKDKEGNDLLTYSVLNNNEKMLPFLKEEFKNKKETESIYYSLAFTEINNYQQQILLEKGIINFSGNEELKKPLKKDEEFVNQNIANINYQDSDGNTPALVACANNLPFLVSLYIKMGADLNLPNKLGETPLMHAIGTKNRQLIEYLVNNKADCDAQTINGKTVLEFAQETGNLEIENMVRDKMKVVTPSRKPKF